MNRERDEAVPASGGGGRFILEGPGGQRVRLTGRARGAAVVEALKAVLEEAHMRQVTVQRMYALESWRRCAFSAQR